MKGEARSEFALETTLLRKWGYGGAVPLTQCYQGMGAGAWVVFCGWKGCGGVDEV